MFRDLGDRLGQAEALNDLGVVQRQTGDYPAAAASHQQALELFRDLGDRHGQASALNDLGDRAAADRGLPGRRRQPPAGPGHVPRPRRPARPGRGAEPPRRASSRTSDSQQARDHHAQALAIARELGAPLEEARALEGTRPQPAPGRRPRRRRRAPAAGTRRSTSASAPRTPGGSRKPCASTASPQPRRPAAKAVSPERPPRREPGARSPGTAGRRTSVGSSSGPSRTASSSAVHDEAPRAQRGHERVRPARDHLPGVLPPPMHIPHLAAAFPQQETADGAFPAWRQHARQRQDRMTTTTCPKVINRRARGPPLRLPRSPTWSHSRPACCASFAPTTVTRPRSETAVKAWLWPSSPPSSCCPPPNVRR